MALYVTSPRSPLLFKRGPNLLDVDATLTPGTDWIGIYVLPAGVQTANRAITLSNAGAVNGQVVDIVKEGTEAFTLTILNAAAGTILVIAAGTSVRVECYFNGAWVLSVWCYV